MITSLPHSLISLPCLLPSNTMLTISNTSMPPEAALSTCFKFATEQQQNAITQHLFTYLQFSLHKSLSVGASRSFSLSLSLFLNKLSAVENEQNIFLHLSYAIQIDWPTVCLLHQHFWLSIPKYPENLLYFQLCHSAYEYGPTALGKKDRMCSESTLHCHRYQMFVNLSLVLYWGIQQVQWKGHQ